MTDYSSDSSSSSSSVASHMLPVEADIDADAIQRALERKIDPLIYYDDGSFRFPFNHIRAPETVIFQATSGVARDADVVRRLDFKERSAWEAMWNDEEGKYACRFDADALDALVEVGFRVGNGQHGVMYNVVCKLLDARYP